MKRERKMRREERSKERINRKNHFCFFGGLVATGAFPLLEIPHSMAGCLDLGIWVYGYWGMGWVFWWGVGKWRVLIRVIGGFGELFQVECEGNKKEVDLCVLETWLCSGYIVKSEMPILVIHFTGFKWIYF